MKQQCYIADAVFSVTVMKQEIYVANRDFPRDSDETKVLITA